MKSLVLPLNLRSIANLIDIPLDFTEALLYKGFNTIPLGPMPWVMILGLVIILGLYPKRCKSGNFGRSLCSVSRNF